MDVKEKKLWAKTKSVGLGIGKDIIYKIFCLFFVMRKKEVPTWVKVTAASALGYFIVPVDTVPDFIVGLGYTDDVALITSAFVTLNSYIDDEIKSQAEEAFSKVFKISYR